MSRKRRKRFNFENKTEKSEEDKLYERRSNFLTHNRWADQSKTDVLEFDDTVNVCDRCGKETPKSTIIINDENLCLSEIRLQYRISEDIILIRFQYDKELVSFVKSLDGAKFNEFGGKNWIVDNNENNKKALEEFKYAFKV